MKKAKKGEVADLDGVELPGVNARKREMLAKIRELRAGGYTRFQTRVVRCLNCVESPDPDPAIEGYDNVGFWHDCHKRNMATGDYNDIILYAAK